MFFLLKKQLPLFVLALCVLWASLFLAWQTLGAFNFAYPWLYEKMAIDESIALYAPQNLYKKDFQLTTDEERFRLFSEIVDAIHHNGEGLSEISYYDSQGNEIDRLLRSAEVVHLQDVANLLSYLQVFSWLVIAAMVATWGGLLMSKSQIKFLANKMFIRVLVFSILVVVGLMLYGAERLFYQWHTLVFPEGHQWFFYYQESLMTTMMRAPDLFGAIAVLLGVLAMLYFFIALKLIEITLNPRLSSRVSL